MDSDKYWLARRAVAAKMEWQSGMLTAEGYRLIRFRTDGRWVCAAVDQRGMGRVLGVEALYLGNYLPDLDDDATKGGLLGQARRRWNRPYATPRYWQPTHVPGPDWDGGWDWDDDDIRAAVRGPYATEAEALVAALAAAPGTSSL